VAVVLLAVLPVAVDKEQAEMAVAVMVALLDKLDLQTPVAVAVAEMSVLKLVMVALVLLFCATQTHLLSQSEQDLPDLHQQPVLTR
jgi:hypothetical protein